MDTPEARIRVAPVRTHAGRGPWKTATPSRRAPPAAGSPGPDLFRASTGRGMETGAAGGSPSCRATRRHVCPGVTNDIRGEPENTARARPVRDHVAGPRMPGTSPGMTVGVAGRALRLRARGGRGRMARRSRTLHDPELSGFSRRKGRNSPDGQPGINPKADLRMQRDPFTGPETGERVWPDGRGRAL